MDKSLGDRLSEILLAPARSIPRMGIKSTDFNLTDEDKQALLEPGRTGARSLLESFDFEDYKRKWRPAAAPA